MLKIQSQLVAALIHRSHISPGCCKCLGCGCYFLNGSICLNLHQFTNQSIFGVKTQVRVRYFIPDGHILIRRSYLYLRTICQNDPCIRFKCRQLYIGDIGLLISTVTVIDIRYLSILHLYPDHFFLLMSLRIHFLYLIPAFRKSSLIDCYLLCMLLISYHGEPYACLAGVSCLFVIILVGVSRMCHVILMGRYLSFSIRHQVMNLTCYLAPYFKAYTGKRLIALSSFFKFEITALWDFIIRYLKSNPVNVFTGDLRSIGSMHIISLGIHKIGFICLVTICFISSSQQTEAHLYRDIYALCRCGSTSQKISFRRSRFFNGQISQWVEFTSDLKNTIFICGKCFCPICLHAAKRSKCFSLIR